MIRKEALFRLYDGESLTLEYKQATNKVPKDIYETVVSFSNRNGGFIYLGINDQGRVIGVDKSELTTMKNDFSTVVNNPNKINPPLYLGLEELEVDGKLLLFAYIPISSQVHRLNQHKIMDRNASDGDIDVTNNTHAVQEMFRCKDATFTENQIYPYLKIEDFRVDLIERIRKAAAINRLEHPFSEMSDLEIMKSLGMYRQDLAIREEGFTLAAVLCFGKNQTIASVVNYWRVDVLERTTNRERYDNRLNCQTNLIDTYYEVMLFLKNQSSLPKTFIMNGSERVEARNILFREVVANMLVHRELANAFVSTITIYPEKIEVVNANKPINPGVVTAPTISPYPKNPTIAKVFNYLGIIDELGSGIGKIFNYAQLYFGANPVIENESLFKVTMERAHNDALENKKIKVSIIRGSNEERVLFHIKKHGKITSKETRELLGVGEVAARSTLRRLLEMSLIKWVGRSKNDPQQYYVATEYHGVPRSITE